MIEKSNPLIAQSNRRSRRLPTGELQNRWALPFAYRQLGTVLPQFVLSARTNAEAEPRPLRAWSDALLQISRRAAQRRAGNKWAGAGVKASDASGDPGACGGMLRGNNGRCCQLRKSWNAG